MEGWFGRKEKPSFLSIDLETRSEVDLGKCGVYKYVEGAHWGILLFCYLFEGDEDVTMCDVASGEELPPAVLSALEDPDIIKYAWNASFERTNLSRYLGHRLDPRQWRCTMVWAAEMSLPLSLKNAAEVLKVPQQKDRAGDALIRKFSVPQKPTKSNGMKEWLEPSDLPEQWEAFKSYCKQDVRTEDAIRRRLENFPLPMSEWEMYWLDQDINDRGIQIDVDLAKAAMECDAQIGGKLMDEAKELTGLENPGSVQQMQGWLRSKGVYLDSLGKELVQDQIDAMEKDPTADREALRMLKLRIKMAKSSVKKYDAAERCTCEDGRARGLFQFYGAGRTGRYSGRLIQLQNLKRNSISYLTDVRSLIKSGEYDTLDMLCDDVPDVLSQCVRTMLVPKPGHEFIVADFSAIEARCIAWEAGEESTLQDFRNGKDLYCAMASKMFGVPVEKHGQNAELRSRGKIAVLACLMKGSLVLTDQGLIPIEDVTLDMKLWDGEEWVSHRGVVYKGRRKVYRWGGVSATADHPFLTVNGDFHVEGYKAFKDIWSSKRNLWFCMGERDGKPVKLGDGYSVGKGVPRDLGLRDVYDIVNAGPRHRFTVSGVIVHNCGYGGSAGAMIAMGALKMGLKEDELPGIVQAYREANPNIVRFWWKLDNAATDCIEDHQEHDAGIVRFEFNRNVLWMVLPSGRKLAYVAPRIGKNRFGGRSIEFQGIGLNNKWQTLETYGAKLSENCCKKGTRVLTKTEGWKPIESITLSDEIWDGEEWVPHEGIVCKGTQEVIEVSTDGTPGIWVTSNHLILTAKGWMESGKAAGFDWAEVRIPDGYQPSKKQQPGKSSLELFMRMRENARSRFSAFIKSRKSKSKNIMWMHEGEKYLGKINQARDDETPGIRGMAFDDTEMHRTDASSLEKLWRTGHQSLRQMAAQFREFLGRHGVNVEKRPGSRSYRQRRKLLPRELSMGNQESQFSEPKKDYLHKYGVRKDTTCRILREDRVKLYNVVRTSEKRMAGRISISPTRDKAQVFDILNCGPRNRFCVLDPGTGAPRIVHNCTQAIARDILCNSIKNLEAEGIRVVAHVHDECICEVPIGKYAVDDICQIMARNPEWCKELPLTAAGYLAPDYYFKD